MRHLEDMRGLYLPGTLDEASLAPTWLEQVERWLDEAIAAPLPEANAMVLATADARGRPSARTVLLKVVDERGFVLYTNLDSRKGHEARENPWASLVFAWTPLHRQIVVTGAIEPVPDAEADAYFASRPRQSQISAWASQQSQPVESREFMDRKFHDMEQKFLNRPVDRPAHWSGFRLVPNRIEFWQADPDRFHDRFRYQMDGQNWKLTRLFP